MMTAPGYARFLHQWHGLSRPRSGSSARRCVLGRLQGYAAPYSDLEDRILPARLADYEYGMLDSLCQRGALSWQGLERLSSSDGVVAIYRPDALPLLARIRGLTPGVVCTALRELLAAGPCDFERIKSALGGFPSQLLDGLWDMVWMGEVSNRRLLPLQALRARRSVRRGAVWPRRRPEVPVGAAGEWYLLAGPGRGFAGPEERDRALARQLLHCWGIVGRRSFAAAGASGAFAHYERALEGLAREEKARRGVFVQELGAVQFAHPRAVELGNPDAPAGTWVLAASDPANPYGGPLPWPKAPHLRRGPQRVAGAQVVLNGGELIAYLSGRGQDLLTFGAGAASDERLVAALAGQARPGRPLFLRSIDGLPPGRSPLARVLRARGFVASRQGFLYRA